MTDQEKITAIQEEIKAAGFRTVRACDSIALKTFGEALANGKGITERSNNVLVSYMSAKNEVEVGIMTPDEFLEYVKTEERPFVEFGVAVYAQEYGWYVTLNDGTFKATGFRKNAGLYHLGNRCWSCVEALLYTEVFENADSLPFKFWEVRKWGPSYLKEHGYPTLDGVTLNRIWNR